MSSKDQVAVAAAIGVVVLIACLVLALDRIFPAPALPTPVQNNHSVPVGWNGTQVQVIEFSDFECPFCRRGSQIIAELQQSYGPQIAVEFKHFPVHKDSQKAAEAAECARDQDMFWEYHDLLFSHQGSLGVEKLKRYAADLGLDAEAFALCLDSGSMASKVKADYQAGLSYGIQGTPTYFINGRLIEGAQDIAVFMQVIDDELGSTEP